VAKLQMKVENKHVEEIARSSLVDTQVREASVQVAVLHKKQFYITAERQNWSEVLRLETVPERAEQSRLCRNHAARRIA
jgi:hypothetical protein